ncbi:NUDIX domain-containing protein [Undibacterium sp. SXout11W]|uniref:NUDIX domain-containing protein n=1 Tax=Undibacterium sp. SXout11W TaxID=3413050 RepID=UPI003BF15525
MELRFCPVCAGTLATRADEQDPQKLRLSCPDGHWTHWDNPLPVLAALVEVDGKVLLARNAAWPEKNFALITGFMERGETPEQGIARELKEETNLDADTISLIGVYEFIKKNEVIIAYHVTASGEISLSPELIEYRLIEPQKLRPWHAGTGHAMADWMRSNGYDPVYAEWPSG